MLHVTFVQHCAQKKVGNVKNHTASRPTHVKSNTDRAETKKREQEQGRKKVNRKRRKAKEREQKAEGNGK